VEERPLRCASRKKYQVRGDKKKGGEIETTKEIHSKKEKKNKYGRRESQLQGRGGQAMAAD